MEPLRPHTPIVQQRNRSDQETHYPYDDEPSEENFKESGEDLKILKEAEWWEDRLKG